MASPTARPDPEAPLVAPRVAFGAGSSFASPSGSSAPSGGRFALYPLWRAIVFAQALTAFLCLTLTGELPDWVVVAVPLALAAGYLVPRPPAWWSPWMGVVATILAMIPIARGMTPEFFQGVLNLLLFLLVAKCLSLRTARDHLQAQLLGFFTMLSAAVITVSVFFLFVFTAYSLLALFGLLLHGLARPYESVARGDGFRRGASHEALEAARAGAGRPPRRFLRLGFALAIPFLALVAFFFYFIPHVSLETVEAPLSTRQAPPDRLTGFGEDVEFGQFKNILPDSTVVMSVEPGWPAGQTVDMPSSILLRGLALEHYDERRWTTSPRRARANIWDAQEQGLKARTLHKGRMAHFEVYQDPEITMRVFTVPWPVSVNLHARRRIRIDEDLMSIQVVALGTSRDSTYTNPFRYQIKASLAGDATDLLPQLVRRRALERELVLAALGHVHDERALEEHWRGVMERGDVPDPLPWLLSGPPPDLVAQERLIGLQMPEGELTRRIAEMAARETAGLSDDAAIADRLVNVLRSGYEYTLAPDLPPGRNPVEYFLFESRKGHCEFFATALALMLRTRGIPARLVNGFHASEWNRPGGFFVVRQSDAHSWVEAWIEGVGWLTLDPTPPGSVGRAAYGGLGGGRFYETWSDYLRIQWQRLVIDYSVNKQVGLIDQLRDSPGFGSLLKGAARLREALGGRTGEDAAAAQTEMERRRDRYIRVVTDLAILGGAVFLLGTIAGYVVRRVRSRGSVADRSDFAWFDALLECLERAARRRAPGETHEEFVESLPTDRFPVDRLRATVAAYYRQRFAGEPPTPDERAEARRLRDAIAAARRASRGRGEPGSGQAGSEGGAAA